MCLSDSWQYIENQKHTGYIAHTDTHTPTHGPSSPTPPHTREQDHHTYTCTQRNVINKENTLSDPWLNQLFDVLLIYGIH